MQRDISDKNTLGYTLNPINDIRRSTAIDRTISNYNKKYVILSIWENMPIWLNTFQVWQI